MANDEDLNKFISIRSEKLPKCNLFLLNFCFLKDPKDIKQKQRNKKQTVFSSILQLYLFYLIRKSEIKLIELTSAYWCSLRGSLGVGNLRLFP